jgi:hypothetical protein
VDIEQILRVVADYQWWIFGAFGLLFLFFLRRALLARREGARSIFKLEQEQARGKYARSVVAMVIILILMAAIFSVNMFLLPSLNRPPEPTPTATSGPLVAPTLTATPPPATITPTATATRVRPTRPVRPTATPEVVATEPPAVRPPSCPNPNVRLTSPGVNQVVRGNVPIRGTANIANFQYYKVEVGPGASPKDNEWTVVGQLHQAPVSGGLLETFNSNAYPPGTYTLRLVVVDNTGNYPAPCRVTVSVQR